jgi:hypothetical protein
MSLWGTLMVVTDLDKQLLAADDARSWRHVPDDCPDWIREEILNHRRLVVVAEEFEKDLASKLAAFAWADLVERYPTPADFLAALDRDDLRRTYPSHLLGE